MTAEEKKSIVSFIDLASDLVRGGYSLGERDYNFSDDLAAVGSLVADGGLAAQNSLVMVIGDVSGPGEEARLLDKMLGSIGLSKESNCFITDVIECESRLQSMKPRFILCLGESAAQALLHSAEPIGKLRGKFADCKIAGMTIPLIATYHPSALLRNEELKRPCWDDLKALSATLRAGLGAEVK